MITLQIDSLHVLLFVHIVRRVSALDCSLKGRWDILAKRNAGRIEACCQSNTLMTDIGLLEVGMADAKMTEGGVLGDE